MVPFLSLPNPYRLCVRVYIIFVCAVLFRNSIDTNYINSMSPSPYFEYSWICFTNKNCKIDCLFEQNLLSYSGKAESTNTTASFGRSWQAESTDSHWSGKRWSSSKLIAGSQASTHGLPLASTPESTDFFGGPAKTAATITTRTRMTEKNFISFFVHLTLIPDFYTNSLQV